MSLDGDLSSGPRRVVRGYVDVPNRHGVELTFEAMIAPRSRVAHLLSHARLETLCGMPVTFDWDATQAGGMAVCKRCVRAAL